MTARSFTTDKEGRLPAGVSLRPNATYRLVPEPRPAETRLQSPSELVDWIRECVLGDLRLLRWAMLSTTHERRVAEKWGGGNFLLLAGCLMALEYLARVYSEGDNAADGVRRYVREFLAPVNPRYEAACDILWRAMRNGMIHQSWPLRIAAQADGPVLRFGVGGEEKDTHLELLPSQAQPTLGINSPRFLTDLDASVTPRFIDWIMSTGGEAALERGQPRLLQFHPDDVIKGEFAEVLTWTGRDWTSG